MVLYETRYFKGSASSALEDINSGFMMFIKVSGNDGKLRTQPSHPNAWFDSSYHEQILSYLISSFDFEPCFEPIITHFKQKAIYFWLSKKHSFFNSEHNFALGMYEIFILIEVSRRLPGEIHVGIPGKISRSIG